MERANRTPQPQFGFQRPERRGYRFQRPERRGYRNEYPHAFRPVPLMATQIPPEEYGEPFALGAPPAQAQQTFAYPPAQAAQTRGEFQEGGGMGYRHMGACESPSQRNRAGGDPLEERIAALEMG
jgi:hypothetical protein